MFGTSRSSRTTEVPRVPIQQKYWFPAKRYGWGWSWPTVWQGWASLAVFFGLLGAGALVLLPEHGAGLFVAYSALLCGLLTVVCWLKGEPPHWR
jgi:hypothetical protein